VCELDDSGSGFRFLFRVLVQVHVPVLVLSSTCSAVASQESRLYRSGRHHACRGHRRQHCHLFAGEQTSRASVACEKPRATGRNRPSIQCRPTAFFETLGVPASVGRTLTQADDIRGGGPRGPAAVISQSFWQRRFRGDVAAVPGVETAAIADNKSRRWRVFRERRRGRGCTIRATAG
jgi:hypothetical protein